MAFPETDHHLLEQIDQIIEAAEDKPVRERCAGLRKAIVERVEKKQKEAVMYLMSTLDVGGYISDAVFESILRYKNGCEENK